MAQVVKLIDDVDGTEEGVETVPVSYAGTDYEIDLGKKNRKTLDGVLQDWLEHAREVGATSRRQARAATAGGQRRSRKDTGAVRAWAKQQGIKISERGRIPADVQARYDATH